MNATCFDRRTKPSSRHRPPLLLVGLAIFLAALALLLSRRVHADELKKSGTVDIEQVQIAFIGSGNLGGGTLNYEGQAYKFTIGGLGIGGFGVSKIEATG